MFRKKCQDQDLTLNQNWHEGLATPTRDACGGFLKSANVSFGQSMPVEAMQRAPRHRQARRNAVRSLIRFIYWEPIGNFFRELLPLMADG